MTKHKISPGMLFFFSKIFPWPFIIIGMVLVFLGGKDIYFALESKNWPSVHGKIQNSSIKVNHNDDSNTYHADLLYTFTVNGQIYTGSLVSFGTWSSSDSSDAKRIAKRYHKGKNVKVYYRSSEPEKCVLEPGMHFQLCLLPIFGILFIAGGTFAAFLPRLLNKSKQNAARLQNGKNNEENIPEISPLIRLFWFRMFPLPFIVVGSFLLFTGIKELYLSSQSVSWPIVQGTIQRSSVEYQIGNDCGTYHASILYQFEINGQTHSGNRVAFGDYGASDSSHAKNIVNHYPQGSNVKIYYSATDPDICVLEPGLVGQTWFKPGLGAIFITSGLLIFLVPIFVDKKRKKQCGSIQSTENIQNQKALSPGICFFISKVLLYIFIVFGSLIFILACYRFYQTVERIHWPTTEGRILKSSLEYQKIGIYHADILYEKNAAFF
jgi:hypothetical protein